MAPAAPSPWPFLLAKLRQVDRTAITRAEIESAGLDTTALLDAGVVVRADNRHWLAPGCERACTAALDFESQKDCHKVGVACPYEPACWPGWKWVESEALETFECSEERIFASLRAVNGLRPLNASLPRTVRSVGLLQRRGLELPVVFVRRAAPAFDELCAGVRMKLGTGHLVVLVSRSGSAGDHLQEDGIVVLQLEPNPAGSLGLGRALDLLDPSYRKERLRRWDAIFDDVALEFATVPGERHAVRINGEANGGFERSDLKFFRLLYLAATRASDPDVDGGGWLAKHKLGGDEKDHDLEDLRKALRGQKHSTFSSDELGSLLKTHASRAGRIRLAVPPHQIRFDASVRQLHLVGPPNSNQAKKSLTPGRRTLVRNLGSGQKEAQRLRGEIRKLLTKLPGMGE